MPDGWPFTQHPASVAKHNKIQPCVVKITGLLASPAVKSSISPFRQIVSPRPHRPKPHTSRYIKHKISSGQQQKKRKTPLSASRPARRLGLRFTCVSTWLFRLCFEPARAKTPHRTESRLAFLPPITSGPSIAIIFQPLGPHPLSQPCPCSAAFAVLLPIAGHDRQWTSLRPAMTMCPILRQQRSP